jgi:hypothetical protein
VIIGAAEPETLRSRLRPGDVLIVGDRVRTQPMALEAGVACLIVTTGTRPSDDVIDLARRKGCRAGANRSGHLLGGAARLARSCGGRPDGDRGSACRPRHPACRGCRGPARQYSPRGRGHRCRRARHRHPHPHKRGAGLRRRVVLVDHNESSQSALGIEDAEVVEIVDHHRVGDIETAGPIMFLNLPVGSTATIVALRYEQLGIEIPKPMAGILLAALLTDTVILKSPTTTETDRQVCERWPRTSDVDPLTFGMEVFRSRSADVVFSADALVRTDVKEYRAGDCGRRDRPVRDGRPFRRHVARRRGARGHGVAARRQGLRPRGADGDRHRARGQRAVRGGQDQASPSALSASTCALAPAPHGCLAAGGALSSRKKQVACPPSLASDRSCWRSAGGTLVVTAATLLLVALLLRAGRRRDAVYSAALVAAGGLFWAEGPAGPRTTAVRDALVSLPDSFAFPSGHTMGSLCLPGCWVGS